MNDDGSPLVVTRHARSLRPCYRPVPTVLRPKRWGSTCVLRARIAHANCQPRRTPVRRPAVTWTFMVGLAGIEPATSALSGRRGRSVLARATQHDPVSVGGGQRRTELHSQGRAKNARSMAGIVDCRDRRTQREGRPTPVPRRQQDQADRRLLVRLEHALLDVDCCAVQ